MTSPLSDLALRVSKTMTQHRMLDASDRALVGVSGGADSVSLLLVLKELGYAPGIAHLNHGLRGSDSDEDERFVTDLGTRLGIPVFSCRISIRPEERNVEAACRLARREFFRTLCEEQRFTKVAIAHTREDRIETCLLHLMRGTGTEGLVSMAPVSGNIVRPLIESSHEEAQRFLNSRNQPWRTDATNRDTTFARNRLRHEFIPKLRESFNPKLDDAVSRTVNLLQAEDAWMQELTSSWLAEHAVYLPGEVSVSAAALNSAPIALARRAIRSLLRMAGSGLIDVTFEHIESVRSLLADGKSGKTIQLPGNLVAERSFDRLVFHRIQKPAEEFSYLLPIPGEVHIPELGKTFRARLADDTGDTVVPCGSENREWVFVDGGRLGPCVKIRNWKPGDYYKPVGWPGGKLKKLFQRARIPRSQRRRWPVFEIDSTVVWVASFPVSREFVPNGHSRKIVIFEVLF